MLPRDLPLSAAKQASFFGTLESDYYKHRNDLSF